MVQDPNTVPEWPARIRRLLDDLRITQAELAQRLGLAPSNVSRWMRGSHEPTAEAYVALGNLAGSADSAFFFERAGFDPLSNWKLVEAMSSTRVDLEELNVITFPGAAKRLSGSAKVVAIPLLAVTAYGDRVPPVRNVNLSEVEVEDVLLAPLSWCPHAERMISMHIEGDSMVPVIAPGSLLFVDTAVKDRGAVDGKLAVVSHRELGFKVARFQRLKTSDLLISANHKYSPLDVSNSSKWKIFGQVLWWVSRDQAGQAQG